MLKTKMAMQARFVQRPHFGHSRRAGLETYWVSTATLVSSRIAHHDPS
jgi:hypothetical protein